MKSHLALFLGLLLALQAPADAQRPDPNSPRYKAVMELRDLLLDADAADAAVDDRVARFVSERVAPSLAESKPDLSAELADACRSASGGQFNGASPGGPTSATIRFRLASGTSAGISLEFEAEAPHRFLRLDLNGFASDPGFVHRREDRPRPHRVSRRSRGSGSLLGSGPPGEG